MSTRMFSKVLIANRGEIACRIMRTCNRLGIQTVAVYSNADADSLHVRKADEAVNIGGSAAQESYLAVDKIIAAAKKTGARAIHPGYGFLSENETFAKACAEASIVFIGPPVSAIRAMGSKSAAKQLMQKAGVPLTPGYHGDVQDPAFLRDQASAIGYPVLIKASAGGGGKGMRRVDEQESFIDALAACKREASASFGDDHVLVEKYVLQPRHIEIQVFADSHGSVVSLFERDCSVQRRHQKVLEEAPAPGMTVERRAAMGKAACDAARAVGYVGAGTVEFIADVNGSFHFMEMNTRLQVEHPVTEMITGLDLVEWQLRVAAGEALPARQEDLRITGHAIEARIYAEDPSKNFLPSIGRLSRFRKPQTSAHVRVDAGVEEGDTITPFYDPMMAKLIVWESTRDDALRTMSRALSEFQVSGVETNVGFLQRLAESSSFVGAVLDTALIERESTNLFAPALLPSAEVNALAALIHVTGSRSSYATATSPWASRDGWRINSLLRRNIAMTVQDHVVNVLVEYGSSSFTVRVGEDSFKMTGRYTTTNDFVATIDDRQLRAAVVQSDNTLVVFVGGEKFDYVIRDPLAEKHTHSSKKDGGMLAPMPGIVTSLLVSAGEPVEKGTALLTLEAMKMEYTIKAPTSGAVEAFFFQRNEQVPEGAQLLAFKSTDADAEQG